MIIALVFSVAISGSLLVLLGDVFAHQDPATALLVRIAIVLASGYHRAIVDKEDRVSWLRLRLPETGVVRVRNTLWGLPVSKPRKIRVAASTLTEVAQGSLKARLRLVLPVWLGWAVPR